jgi:GTPase SAR1 family protein
LRPARVDGKEYYLDIREQYIYSFELQPGNRHFTPDVVLICAAVRSRASFQNILDKWMPELQFHMPGARLVVVATQTDLRNDERTVRLHSQRGPSHRMVSYEDGVEIAGRAGTRYVECSAHNKENVEGVFEEVRRHIPNHNGNS